MAIVTVCVLTYNPDWTKFQNTLKSIICQKGVDFDIVISDDGSKNNCFDKAEKYLKENNFSAYCFIANKQNQGTVKNTISALQTIKSKYVKLISPGDFLYDETVLAKFTDFAEKNPAAAYFGNAVYYSTDEYGEIKIYETLHNPIDLKPWIEKDEKKIRRNYLYRSDYILGASLFCNKAVFWDYVKRLDGIVKYAEDMAFLLMIVNKIRVLYVNQPFVFYEYGVGISTNNAMSNLVSVDLMSIYNILCIKKLIPKYLLYFRKDNSIQNKTIRFLIKLVKDPFSLLHIIFKRKDYIVINVNESICKLNHIFTYFSPIICEKNSYKELSNV